MNRDVRRIGRIVAIVFVAAAFMVSVTMLAASRYGLPAGELLDKLAFWREEQTVEADVQAGWRYLDDGEPGVGNLWATDYFDPRGWKTAEGPFSEAGEGVALASCFADGTPTPTYFFRRTFEVGDPGRIWGMTGVVRYTGAVIVYLNGEIIFAGNVPAGGYQTNQETGCAMNIEGVSENRFVVTDLSALRAGENVLAVELHQADPEKDQAWFDLAGLELIPIDMPGEEAYEEDGDGESEDEAGDPMPGTDGLSMEQGPEQTNLTFQYRTASDDFYQLLYATVSEVKKVETMVGEEYAFASAAESVLMGRVYDEAQQVYVNRAPVERLQAGEDYLYAVARVGSRAISDTLAFTAHGLDGFTLGTPGVGSMAKVDMALTASEDDLDDPLFQSVPAVPLNGRGNACLTCQDTLILVLDTENVDWMRQEAFVRESMAQYPRLWTLAVMSAPSADGQTWKDMLLDAGVDAALSCGGKGASQVEEDELLYVAVGDDGSQAALTVIGNEIRGTVWDGAGNPARTFTWTHRQTQKEE